MPEMDKEQLEEVKEVYGHFDSDSNGVIDYSEFQKIVDALDAGMSEQEMKIGFDEIDSDDNQCIDFEEFIDWWSDR